MANWNRRNVVRAGALGLAVSVAGPFAHSQAPRRTPRIGLIIGEVPQLLAAFDEELSRLGWVDGRNIHVVRRLPRANSDDGQRFAAELASMDLDLVVAGALPFALQGRDANSAMPMVVAFAPGLVSNGFARSLDHPGGVTTGVDELPPGLTARRVELLKMAAPQVKRIGLLSTTAGVGGHETQVRDAQAAAQRADIAVRAYRAANLQQLTQALQDMLRDGVDGLMSFQGGLSVANRQMIVDFAAAHRLPAIYQSEMFVEAGGLMAWAPDQPEQMRVSARYVDRILKGAHPGDLPITYPEKYFLFLNSAAADRIGLVFPEAVRALAHRVTTGSAK